jgi:capsule polysaccharide export protein KpsE/RkpR
MQNDIAALEKQAKSLAAQESADQKRIIDLRNRIAELKKQMAAQSSALDALEGSGLGDQQVDLRRQQLEQQRNALRREYELLMKMQMELAG